MTTLAVTSIPPRFNAFRPSASRRSGTDLALWLPMHRWILLLWLVLSLIGAGYFSARLYKNLRTNLDELLPTFSQERSR